MIYLRTLVEFITDKVMVPVHTSTWFILVTVGLVPFSQQGGEIYKQPVVRLEATMGKYIKGRSNFCY